MSPAVPAAPAVAGVFAFTMRTVSPLATTTLVAVPAKCVAVVLLFPKAMLASMETIPAEAPVVLGQRLGTLA